MKRLLVLILVVLFSSTSCRPLVTPTPTAVAPTATDRPQPASKAAAAKTPTPATAGVPEPAPEPAGSPGAAEAIAAAEASLPAPSLFDTDWEDRTLYASSLVSGQQTVLEGQPGAPIYHMAIEIGDDLVQIQGNQEVLYTNRTGGPLEAIYFHLYPNLTGGALTISGLRVNGSPVVPTYQLRDSAMEVPLNSPLQPGDQAVIAMEFAVTVPTDESSNYGTFAYLGDVLALAHFYPMVVAHDESGWDLEIPSPQGDVIYADAGFYLVRATGPSSLVIAASGVALEEELKDGRQVLTFASGPARDFYLAASKDYEVLRATVGETTVRSYAFPETSEGSELALDYAIAALRSFEERFGPYPLTELDLVQTATSALGVEYPGIVAIANRIYNADALQYLEATVAHEVGHQWFYNVVGNDQLEEPWLDEALTQYATLLYFEDAYGQRGYDGFRDSLTSRWNRVNLEEIPIGLPVRDYEGREYGAIVYGRGPLFFEALEAEMGAETFARFLRDYYATFAWENVDTEALRNLAEQHCQCDLTPLFEEWVYAGAPS